jgi:hypothetical protein
MAFTIHPKNAGDHPQRVNNFYKTDQLIEFLKASYI